MLHNAHPKRNMGSAKRGDTLEAKSGKPINVVHICPVLSRLHSPLQLFSDCYRKNRSSFANGRKKKLVEVQGCQFSQKKIKEGIQMPLDHRASNLIHLTKK